MVDEMDLLRELKATESVRPRAFEEARALLRAAVAVERAAMAVEEVPETTTAPRWRARWWTRRTAGFGIAGLVAAAAAAALAVSSISLDKPIVRAAGCRTARTPMSGPVFSRLGRSHYRAGQAPHTPLNSGSSTDYLKDGG